MLRTLSDAKMAAVAPQKETISCPKQGLRDLVDDLAKKVMGTFQYHNYEHYQIELVDVKSSKGEFHFSFIGSFSVHESGIPAPDLVFPMITVCKKERI